MSPTSSPSPHPSDERITAQGFETGRLLRRLDLLEQSIAEGERALRGSIDPDSGEGRPAARDGHREQILSNLVVERSLAETIRRVLASHR